VSIAKAPISKALPGDKLIHVFRPKSGRIRVRRVVTVEKVTPGRIYTTAGVQEINGGALVRGESAVRGDLRWPGPGEVSEIRGAKERRRRDEADARNDRITWYDAFIDWMIASAGDRDEFERLAGLLASGTWDEGGE